MLFQNNDVLQELFHITRGFPHVAKPCETAIFVGAIVLYIVCASGIKLCVYSSSQQVKSGIHQSGLTLCDVSSAATSPSLPFPGTSLPPVLDLSSQHAEGSGSRVLLLVNNNTVNKLETPEALCDKPPCALFPAVEAAKTQDYPRPQPIPEGKNGSLPVSTSEICWTKDNHCPDSPGVHAVMTVTQLYNFLMLLKLSN